MTTLPQQPTDEDLKAIARRMQAQPWGMGSRPDDAVAYARAVLRAFGESGPAAATLPQQEAESSAAITRVPALPFDSWAEYAMREGLLDSRGIAPDRAKTGAAYAAFAAGWNASARNDGVTPGMSAVASHPSPPSGGGWQPMETAPKDGTEILAWREDCDVLLVRWTSWDAFATDKERDEIDEDSLFQEDWFYADFREGGRLEGAEVPTHWQPLPPPPEAGSQMAEAVQRAADACRDPLPAEHRDAAHSAVRRVGGIVHGDGNIFFTKAEQFIVAAQLLCGTRGVPLGSDATQRIASDAENHHE